MMSTASTSPGSASVTKIGRFTRIVAPADMIEHVTVVPQERTLGGEAPREAVERLDKDRVAGTNMERRHRVGVEDELMRGRRNADGMRTADRHATGRPLAARINVFV